MTSPEVALDIARKEVGYREGRNNYTKYPPQVPTLGWAQNQPWCATFVSWVLQEAGLQGGWLDGDFPRTASVWQMKQWGLKNGRFSQRPSKGAICIFGATGSTHTELLERWDDKYIYTIGGNTNDRGSANGDGVYVMRRPRYGTYVHGFVAPRYKFSSERSPAEARAAVPLPPGVIAAVGTLDDRVTLLGRHLVSLGYDRHYRSGPGPVFGHADLANMADWYFTNGHNVTRGYVIDVVTDGNYRDILNTHKPYLPTANICNPADWRAASLIKMAGIKLDVLNEKWPWARNGDRGYEWGHLIRRLQERCGDAPDPYESAELGPLQVRRLATLTGLFNAVD